MLKPFTEWFINALSCKKSVSYRNTQCKNFLAHALKNVPLRRLFQV
jgi:hypothetical protein